GGDARVEAGPGARRQLPALLRRNDRHRDPDRRHRRTSSPAAGPFAATLAAEAATWPLMLANFHQLSLVAPAANALVLPLLPAIMVLGGGGALLAGWPFLQAAGAIASWFRFVVETTGSLPLAAVVTPYFPPRW